MTHLLYKWNNFGKHFQRKLTQAGLNKTKVSQINNQKKRWFERLTCSLVKKNLSLKTGYEIRLKLTRLKFDNMLKNALKTFMKDKQI